jgi:hypothetical protein
VVNGDYSESGRGIFDTTDQYNEPTISFSSGRVAITNELGIAIFNQLTTVDVKIDACLRFYFVVGQIKANISVTNKTNLYCFKSDYKIDFASPYSTVIT